MSYPSGFQHAMHVEAIRKALWQPRSRAAVMVGAGFSRNANSINGSAPPFPLWSDLMRRLQQDLDGSPASGDGIDSLRLAEEYEQVAGRTALDNVLLEMVADTSYEPGELHKLLLNLPWSDVFTTNYDTLLERTRLKIHDIKYDIILTPADIARCERPRIVKLHGSFPSHRPFIFTAEDYRTYPTRFAPFVNMVQQSIMENVFCLMGFSGNDPNLHQWAGWVRDNLGTAARRIYICGVLDLTPARERMYQSMRLIPVDLGPLVPRTKWTAEQRHAKGLEWLLLTLHQGRPVERHVWPEVPSIQVGPRVDAELPPLIDPPDKPTYSKPPSLPPSEPLTKEMLSTLVKQWSEQRNAYPGWVVIPEISRLRLLHETNWWLYAHDAEKIGPLIEAMSLMERARALYEFVWRARRALVPLPTWLVKAIPSLLECMNPKPGRIDLRDVTTKPEEPREHNDELTEIWVELAFALVNDAWQSQSNQQHERWMKRLESVVKLRQEWQARWCHERCWHSLLQLDEENTRKALKEWPPSPSLPFWEAKRAAMHAELGEIEQATQIAERALETARQGTTAAATNYANLSQEGWLSHCLALLQPLNSNTRGNLINRIQYLKRHSCDPGDDIKQRATNAITKAATSTSTVKHGFDPGVLSETWSVRSEDWAEWVLLQTFHDGALPLRAGSAVLAKKALNACARHVWTDSPHLSISIGILDGDAKYASSVLERASVATLSQDAARPLIQWLLDAARRIPTPGATSSSHEGLQDSLMRQGLQVLSRLILHASPSQLEDFFDLAVTRYSSQRPRMSIKLPIQMFHRLFLAASLEQVFSWLPRLLALPLPGENGFKVWGEGNWMDVLELIPWTPEWRLPTEAERASWEEASVRLLRISRAKDASELRRRAIERLILLSRLGGLEKQNRELLGILWSRTNKLSFPEDLGSVPWRLLQLREERQPGESRRSVIRYLLDTEISDIRQFLTWLSNSSARIWHNETERKHLIEWPQAEADKLLKKLLNWWSRAANPNKLDTSRLLSNLCELLILNTTMETETWESILALFAQAEHKGISVTECSVARLIHEPNLQSEAEHRIRRSLHGVTSEEVQSAISAIIYWAALGQSAHLPPVPPSLLDEWIGNIHGCRQPGLHASLMLLVEATARFSVIFQERHLQTLCDVLDRLEGTTRPEKDHLNRDELLLSPEERIHLRGYASGLAANLAAIYHRKNSPIPPSVATWQKLGATDVLPEVRRAWLRSQGTSSIT